MKQKSFFHLMAMLAALAVGLATFASCGDDDDDDGGSSGTTGSASTASSDNAQIAGTWFGSSGSSFLTLVLNSDGTGSIKMNSTTKPYAHNGNLTFAYTASTATLRLNLTDEGRSVSYDISNLTSSSFTLVNDYDMTYTMRRTGGSSSDTATSGGTASGTKCKWCLGLGDCRTHLSNELDKYYCHGTGKCKWCGGDGLTSDGRRCTTCKGTGICKYCSGSGECSHCNGTGYE